MQIEEQSKKRIDDMIKDGLLTFAQSSGFIIKKVTDTPTDALSVVNRKYVTNNGTVANRPVSSVAVVGQPYFATDTGIPMTYSTQGWRNGVGSIVALNN